MESIKIVVLRFVLWITNVDISNTLSDKSFYLKSLQSGRCTLLGLRFASNHIVEIQIK